MRLNGYRCDGCGKEHLLDPYFDPCNYGPAVLPGNWYVVSLGGEAWHGKLLPWVFCSKECLRHHPLTFAEQAEKE